MAAPAPRQIRTSRWSDDRLDALAAEVVTVKDRTDALARMPERVADKLDEGLKEQRRDAAEHRAAVRGDIAELRAHMQDRFDRVDLDHERAIDRIPKPLGFWKQTAAILLALSPFELAAAAYLLSHL